MAGNDGASHPFDKLRTGLRAFTWTEGQAIRPLCTKLGISPTTFYATLRAVERSVGYVQNVIAQAGVNAKGVWAKLMEVRASVRGYRH